MQGYGRKIVAPTFAKLFQGDFLRHSDFFISLNSKVIQRYWIELFHTELDLLDTNWQRGRQTRSKHHTYKVNRSGSQIKTQRNNNNMYLK